LSISAERAAKYYSVEVMPPPAPPTNTAAPVASVATGGGDTVGNTLSVTNGTWTGGPTFTYRWQRNGTNVAGAPGAGQTYTLIAGDIGSGTTMTCNVTGTNAQGNAMATSNGIAIP